MYALSLSSQHLNNNSLLSTVLSVVSNSTRTCTCPGDHVTFTCTAIGGEATLWSGSAFHNNCSDITLNHSRFSDTGGVSDLCSDQGIVGLSIERINDCYTSQLTVPMNSDTIDRTVECTVIYNSTVTSLVGAEVIATTGEYRINLGYLHHDHMHFVSVCMYVYIIIMPIGC